MADRRTSDAEQDAPGAAPRRVRHAGRGRCTRPRRCATPATRSGTSHTPFPIHGMDAAMGLRDSTPRLDRASRRPHRSRPRACLMMWWMNGIDYPLVIGGKPPDAMPVDGADHVRADRSCSSAFGAVFGMFGLNRLPRHHHPIFNSRALQGVLERQVLHLDRGRGPRVRRRARRARSSSRCTRSHVELVEERRHERCRRSSCCARRAALAGCAALLCCARARSGCRGQTSARAADRAAAQHVRPAPLQPAGGEPVLRRPPHDAHAGRGHGRRASASSTRRSARAGSPTTRGYVLDDPGAVVHRRLGGAERCSSAARSATASTARPATTAPAAARAW